MKPEEQLKAASIETVTATETIRDQDKIMIVLSYLGILSLIPLLTVKDSNYVKWHAKQGLTLTLAWIVLGIAIGIVSSIIALIPIVRMVLLVSPCIAIALPIGFIAVDIMGIVKGLRGERWRIPFVADLADRF